MRRTARAATFDLLFGATTVFEAGVLEGLYPGGRTEYMERFATALDRSVLSGFILADDEDEIMAGGERERPFRNSMRPYSAKPRSPCGPVGSMELKPTHVRQLEQIFDSGQACSEGCRRLKATDQ